MNFVSISAMALLSSVLYFLIDHNILCLPLFWLLGIATAAIAVKTPRPYKVLPKLLCGFFFVYGFANVFPITTILNSLFLHHFGTPGQAMIVSTEDTAAQYNEHDVRLLHIIVKTADGEDIQTEFDDVGLPTWPIRNQIRIPAVGQVFPVKYIPGAAHNIVVLNEDRATDYGRRQICAAAQTDHQVKRRQYDFSPTNPQYLNDYKNSLRLLYTDCRGSNDDAAERAAEELEQLSH